jgi:hypothetical protein
MMASEKHFEICPVCGSAELYYEMGGYIGKLYRCKVCDYVGPLVLEADEEMAKAIREDYEKRNMRD